MKRFFILCLVTLGLSGCGEDQVGHPLVQEGDILFQSLPHNPLVDVIEGSTHSPYSHCGMAHRTARGWFVIEAIGPVKETPLAEWITHDRDRHFSIYRLRAAYRSRIPDIVKAAQGYLGRPYDLRYEFDDEKIYCSELLYKAFRQTCGEPLGILKKLGELDWKPYEKTIVNLEGGPVPLERLMITPRALSEAAQLECVTKDAR